MAETKTNGILGVFESDDKLRDAVETIREKQFTKFDAFTPFPVHGLDETMGLKRSFLPWVTLIGGLTGAAFGLGFQIWASAVAWPLNVGGKPPISLPAFIPITFECTILFAGLSTAAALFFTLKLPRLNPTVLDPNFTNDKYGLLITSDDPAYDEAQLKDLLKKAGANEVRAI